eukprot:scaffold12837_cov66-Phaeocystis_antarctica.AAC.1
MARRNGTHCSGQETPPTRGRVCRCNGACPRACVSRGALIERGRTAGIVHAALVSESLTSHLASQNTASELGCSVKIEAMGRRGWGWAHCSSPSERCMAGAMKSRAAPARTLSLRLVLLPRPTPSCGFWASGRCKAWCKGAGEHVFGGA